MFIFSLFFIDVILYFSTNFIYYFTVLKLLINSNIYQIKVLLFCRQDILFTSL